MSGEERVIDQTFAPADLIGPLNDVELRNSPAFLHLTGRPELLRNGRRVAIVGSREASEPGLKRAAKLAHSLVENGIIVVSGLARGIDTAAHIAAIEHNGSTIAVLGTPLDAFAPPSNARLQERIGADHLLVTQFATGQPVHRHNFVLRNRTMALISDASVIVEAGEGSGSLSQGWEALRLGRPLFLLRSVVERSTLKWPAEMLNYGAMMLSDVTDLLSALPAESIRRPIDAPF
jgi:DNA processing protein